jgi:hypothetical protein
MNFSAMSKQRKLLLIAAIAGVISIFLPWHQVGGFSEGFSINGFHGVGVLVFFLFAAVGVFAIVGDQTKPLDKTFWLITLAAGVIALLSIVARLSGASDAFGILSPGIGLWIALAVSIGIVAFAWMYKTPGHNLQDAFDGLKKNISASTNSPVEPKAPTSTGTSKIDELEKLIELKNQGKITEEEYQSLKSKII